jgi:short-subunit dehydrogenase
MMNKIALITGATSGRGEAFARKLASQNYDLVITGRRADKLKQLADELMVQHKVNIEIMLVELAKEEHVKLLLQKIVAIKNLDLLINNAGFNIRKKFIDIDIQQHIDMMMVHDCVPMRLMHTALKNMLANNHGAIINVSSVSAFWPTLNNGSYNATKAYLNLLTENVALDIKESKVRVQALCLGMTRTDIWGRMGENIDEITAKRGWPYVAMKPEEVVDASLRALKKNQVICVPRYNYKLLAWMGTLKRLFSLL